ncbi:MAG: sigma-70 family RNA polymerase sigma factor, partial [Phycisphaerales bacterium]
MSDSSIARLVTDAQLGGQNSMDKLAKLARERLYAYLYRVTLDHELTEDLLQETLLQMVKSLKDLKKPGSFWPWMYRVAMGKAQHHFRTKTRRGKVIALSQFSKELAADADCSHHEDGLNQVIKKELAQAIVKAISQLRFKHRNVLVLRCFEQRPYTEIASIMDCSRTTAQVMFFRAKQSLKKQLARQGMSKALVLPGLVLFGKLTASSKAAIASASVTATSTEVSLLAALVGSASTKVGMSILAIILAALMTTGIISVKNPGRNAP